MRKVKLFFLLTALLAIAQGAWAATKTFTSFVTGNNTQSPVTVYCDYTSSLGAGLAGGQYGSWNITISVSAGILLPKLNLEFLTPTVRTLSLLLMEP